MSVVTEFRRPQATSGKTSAHHGAPDNDGEHADVILRDLLSRPRPHGHVITFANEKGGVGKSTLAFQVAIALADAGEKVAVIDLDRRQQTLARVLGNREATSRRLKADLPCPRYVTLAFQSGASLAQEIARIGWDCRFVILDVAGSDSPIARRAIAMADTLVTPVNNSFADLDLLGQFNAISPRPRGLGHFAQLVHDLREARTRHRLADFDWVVPQNRVRRSNSSNEASINLALKSLAKMANFRTCPGLGERVAYRELFLLGLTHFDLKRIPDLAKLRATSRGEIEQLVQELRLPEPAKADLFGSRTAVPA